MVGSNTVVEVGGKKLRARVYPWGVAEGNMAFFAGIYFHKWSRELGSHVVDNYGTIRVSQNFIASCVLQLPTL